MKVALSLSIFAVLAGLALSTPLYYGRPGDSEHVKRCSSPRRPNHGGHDGSEDYYSKGHKVTYYMDMSYMDHHTQHANTPLIITMDIGTAPLLIANVRNIQYCNNFSLTL